MLCFSYDLIQKVSSILFKGSASKCMCACKTHECDFLLCFTIVIKDFCLNDFISGSDLHLTFLIK